MTLKEFKASLQNPQPVYLLVTDQPFLRDRVYEACRDQVPEQSRAFDWMVLDLEETPPEEAAGRIRTLPWFSDRRWVYVRNAHLGEKVLAPYLQAPSDRTVLVLEAPRRPASWPKLPEIELGPVGDPENVVRTLVRRENYQIEEDAARLLVDLVGSDLQQLQSELEKQFLYCLESRRIDVDSVLALVMEVRERDVWELIGCLAAGKAAEAITLLRRLLEGGAAPLQVLATLYWNFSRLLALRERLQEGDRYPQALAELKLWSYRGREREVRGLRVEFLRDLLLRLREADRLAKTTATDLAVHLEVLLVDTCRRPSV